MEKLILIDGNSLANRAFYAVPPLTNRDGFVTNAIFGFVNMLKKVRQEEKPDYLAVAFDAGKTVFRHEMYADYKGSRKATPEDLKAQFPVLRELLSAMGLPWLELAGFEADDLIGTLAAMGCREGLEVRIITGDRDCFQLIGPQTTVLFTRKGISELEYFDEEHLREIYGLKPWQIIELKGLMGDSSDDIPGIPGVGEKTALKLLADHESVEGVLAAAGQYAGKKLGEKLTEYQDLALLSRRLAEIRLDVPLTVRIADCKPGAGDREEMIRLFRFLDFRGLLAEALKAGEEDGGGETTGRGETAGRGETPGRAETPSSAETSGRAETPASAETSGETQAESEAGQTAALPAEHVQGSLFDSAEDHILDRTPLFDQVAAKPIRDAAALTDYLSVLKEGGRLYILPIVQAQNRRSFSCSALGLLTDGQEPAFFTTEEDFRIALTVLPPYLENAAITKVLIDAKQTCLYFRSKGIRLAPPYEDLHLMSYLLDPARPWRMLLGLEDLAPDRLSRVMKEEAKSGISFWNAEKTGACLTAMRYLAGDLNERMQKNNLLHLYQDAEEPLAFILSDMEWTGIGIDPEVLREQGEQLKDKIALAEEEIYRQAGMKFNINSPKQLGEVLFEKLNLSRGKKTKTGYSTDAETLEFLAAEHDIAAEIIAYRQYAKLQGTYVEGLLAIMDPETNRIHSSFNQTITVTGRLSSTEPNLQNIPIRMEEGRQIRKAFIPSPGCCLLSGDYSQIELRILAHLCGDEALRQAFLEGQDIHSKTAAEVFGVGADEVTPALRRAAKAVNFGLIYGISDFGLAQDLGISRAEAKNYMDQYFSRYPGVKQYFDRLLLEAAQKGYVETLFHRRRYLPELKSANYHTRSFGQRAAMNAPIQGTAADIMKLAMVKIKKLLEEEGLGETMVLQVHDELLFDMPEEKAMRMKEEIRSIMENAAVLDVPLQVDVKKGADWYTLEDC